MTLILQCVFAIFCIVLLAEILWRAKVLESEHSRKLIHILVGTFAATWSFYLSDWSIYLITGAMFAVVLVSRLFGLFASIHNVKRKTWGELFFPAGIAFSALLTDSPWVFLLAVIHLGLADGLAAVVGSRYVKKHGYKIFHQQKTIVGSLVFFTVSLFATTFVSVASPELQTNLIILLLLPFITTAIENIGFFGTDDILVPLAVVLMLHGAVV